MLTHRRYKLSNLTVIYVIEFNMFYFDLFVYNVSSSFSASSDNLSPLHM